MLMGLGLLRAEVVLKRSIDLGVRLMMGLLKLAIVPWSRLKILLLVICRGII